jgi:regulator of sigma E protease
MTWVLALGGFCALIVLHELGHFLAAKAVGMRVERFSLFFPPKLLAFRWGETEYQLGALPLGGYVKITGMTAEELATIDPIHADRAYYNKAPWKRIVVILAGPAMNLLIAFVLLAAVLLSGNLSSAVAINNLAPSQNTIHQLPTLIVGDVAKGSGAEGVLAPGDRIVAIDGQSVSPYSVDRALRSSTCAGPRVPGCAATTPARVTVVRSGQRRTFAVTPHYNKSLHKMVLGVNLDVRATTVHYGLVGAVGTSIATMWDLGTSAVTHDLDAIVSSKERRQLQSVVGIAQDANQAVANGPGLALVLLALISLVLAVVNLFPFLPLDGGHIVWSIAEKVRGKRISIGAMWRYSTPGVILLAFLVLSGISNDIGRLGG